jgi:hypothetical protein
VKLVLKLRSEPTSNLERNFRTEFKDTNRILRGLGVTWGLKEQQSLI